MRNQSSHQRAPRHARKRTIGPRHRPPPARALVEAAGAEARLKLRDVVVGAEGPQVQRDGFSVLRLGLLEPPCERKGKGESQRKNSLRQPQSSCIRRTCHLPYECLWKPHFLEKLKTARLCGTARLPSPPRRSQRPGSPAPGPSPRPPRAPAAAPPLPRGSAASPRRTGYAGMRACPGGRGPGPPCTRRRRGGPPPQPPRSFLRGTPQRNQA